MNTLIMKFGGSSVGTTTALTQVLSIVLHERERAKRLMLVVSALEGVTDSLIEAAHLAQLSNRRGYRRIVAMLRHRHLTLVEHLPLGASERAALQADIDRMLFDLLDSCQTLADHAGEEMRPEHVDAIVGVGEKLAARIVAALLRQNNLRGVALDATDLIVTDNVYGNAEVNVPMTRNRIAAHLLPMLDRNIIPVITGYIGATVAGKPTTLGRGGSDYTATVLSLCTDAEEVWKWTDVDGIMSADPREVPETKVIPAISYDEVGEMAYFGARVLHPRMIAPIRQQSIVLRVRNVFKPQEPGTVISANGERSHAVIKAVTSTQGLALTAEHSGSLAAVANKVDEALFQATGSHADIMIASQSSNRSFVCFVIPTTAGPDAYHTLRLALEEQVEARELEPGWTIRPVVIVTAVGARVDEMPELKAKVFEALGNIRVLEVTQGPSHCTLSVIVEPNAADEAVRKIHALIVNSA